MKLGWLQPTPENLRAASLAHKRLERAALLQVYLPLTLAALGSVGLLLLLGARSGAGLASWASLATAVLALLLLGSGLVLIALLVFLSVGIGWLVAVLPPYAEKLRGWGDLGAEVVGGLADRAVAPVVWLSCGVASARGVARALSARFLPPQGG